MADTYDGLLGTTIAGRYELLSVLGAGGMGVVFRARQTAMNRVVAVKLLSARSASNEKSLARFEREMQATSRIEHPNTIRVYDYGAHEGQLFLAMELLAGRPLSKLLLEGALPLERVVRIGTQIGKALIAAHAEGVVHRDLKPDNVMISDIAGERDFVKVLDFGIARFMEADAAPQLTADGAVIGTPAYMAPEQVQGGDIDARTDLYAFGVMLFEMVTGQAPFSGPTTLSLLMKQVKDAPPRPSELMASVPPRLERLILRCLAKDPAERPADAAEVVRELGALVAAPTSTVDMAARDLRRALPRTRRGADAEGARATHAGPGRRSADRVRSGRQGGAERRRGAVAARAHARRARPPGGIGGGVRARQGARRERGAAAHAPRQ